MGSIFLYGSRKLSAPAEKWARDAGRAMAEALDAHFRVGCAMGADVAFLSGLLDGGAAYQRVTVYCVGGQDGSGFLNPTESLPVLRRAEAMGAHMVWWAGGGPDVPLRVRLARRSDACMDATDILFALGVFGAPHSVGSKRSAEKMARRGIRTYAVPDAFDFRQMPRLTPKGAWFPANSKHMGTVYQWVQF